MTIMLHCACGQTFTIRKGNAEKYARCPRCQRAMVIPSRKTLIGGRVRQVRAELFGEDGGPLLAVLLGVSPRRWELMETGLEVSTVLLLRFMAETNANGEWLRTGEGPKFDTGEIY